jgi:predicted nucleic acid-binding protein
VAMRKICVYVDTSVFGGTEDEEFSAVSRRFFERVSGGEFILLISQVTIDELQGAPLRVRHLLEELPTDTVVLVPADPEATALAQAYMDANILGKSSLADALHVATATIAGADLILSWNFRHIVNYDRIHKYNGVNALKGYPPIEIHSPLEVSDADENENL